jgi:hypothetical protein
MHLGVDPKSLPDGLLPREGERHYLSAMVLVSIRNLRDQFQMHTGVYETDICLKREDYNDEIY